MFYEYHRSIGDHYLWISSKGGEGFEFPLHLHKSFELLAVEQGAMKVHISGKNYTVRAGEMALIFPNQLHAYSSPTKSVCRLCIFSADYLPDLIRKHQPVFPMDAAVMDRLYETRNCRFGAKSVLYGIAAQYAGGAPCESEDAKSDELIVRIVQYIENHFAEELSLHTMAKELGYNYRYLSGVINRSFGTTFPRVVNRYRVDLACRMLKKEKKDIIEIAGCCGFESLRNFNRCFKEITGKTPREYRRKE